MTPIDSGAHGERPLKIAAAATVLLPADETPTPLRERLRAVLPEPQRRVSRVIELALLGAHQCMRGQQPEAHCPLYVAVTHGCVADAVTLVTAVSRGSLPMPVGFINLSSNMPGFYVASTLGVHGSNQSVAADDFAFEASLELAGLGREHRAQALIGAIEECAWPLPEHRARLRLAPERLLTEASHWLYVDQDVARPLATVQWVRRYADATAARDALVRERLPKGALLALGGSLRDASREWADALGLVPDAPVEDRHSGHWTAYRICRFVETRPAPALLHVSAGANGCYAVYVTT
jgi:hypothetical protein